MNLSVYLHWPFCRSKCPYCDFMSVPRCCSDEYQEVENLLLQDLINSIRELDNPYIKTVFFGGGTPSLMNASAIERILNFLSKNYKVADNVEISLEANPATFDKQKLNDIKKAGINRLSLGVQSFKDKSLSYLGRIYNSYQAITAAETVANSFSNYSFDFIYGYEGQEIEDLQSDLTQAMSYECPHISCYQLTFEPNTPFYKKLQNNEINQISEDQEIDMYKFINSFLEKYTLKRYEVSNYCLEGFESKHNLAYWKYQNYLGVGPSAHSRLVLDGQKYELMKTYDVDIWKDQVVKNQSAYEVRNKLSSLEQLEELFIVGLRLMEGIPTSSLNENFNDQLLSPVYNKLNQLVGGNLIKPFNKTGINQRIQLTESGLIKINAIINYLFA